MDLNFSQKYLIRIGFLIGLFFVGAVSVQAVTEPELIASNEAQIIDSDKQLFEKAVGLSLQNQWQNAESIYRDLIKRNSQWPEPKNNLSILLLKTNRLDEAQVMLEQAVTSSPSYLVAQKNRTQLYDFLAKQAYNKALGSESSDHMPELELIHKIDFPVKLVEKKVEVIIEKNITTPAADENRLITKHITQQLLDWSRAWSQGDFEHYIESYSTDFIPSDTRKTYTQWRNIRKGRLRFAKGVQVSVENIRVFIESDEFVLVEFEQRYQSATYSDKVLKQVYMQNQQENWLILSERMIKTL